MSVQLAFNMHHNHTQRNQVAFATARQATAALLQPLEPRAYSVVLSSANALTEKQYLVTEVITQCPTVCLQTHEQTTTTTTCVDIINSYNSSI
jgi:hypothetical protein